MWIRARCVLVRRDLNNQPNTKKGPKTMGIHTRELLRPPGLQPLMSGNPIARGGYEVRVGTCGVRGLLTLAATYSGTLARKTLLCGSNHQRMTGEDVQWMLAKGLMREKGLNLEITDKGNALVRAIVALANAEGEGSGV